MKTVKFGPTQMNILTELLEQDLEVQYDVVNGCEYDEETREEAKERIEYLEAMQVAMTLAQEA